MKAILRLECIGDDINHMSRIYTSILDENLGDGVGQAVIGKGPYRQPWVAEITGVDQQYHYARKFLDSQKDYSESNAAGSRGIYRQYILESGKLYEVFSKTGWRSSERYFCEVSEDGDILRVQEPDQCLRNHLVSMS